MINNILPAEHIGLVAAYLSKIALHRNFDRKQEWFKNPLIKIMPNWYGIANENSNLESKAFIETQIYPTGQWINSQVIRNDDRDSFASSGLVECARNIASVIAHLNELGYNYEGREGPCHEALERARHDLERRRKFRGFSFGRTGGEGFRQAAAWFAEFYLDNNPSVKPIPLTRLIHEVKENLAMSDYGSEEYKERLRHIYYKLYDLCNIAIAQALRHSKAFKESSDTWSNKDLYDQFLTQKVIAIKN